MQLKTISVDLAVSKKFKADLTKNMAVLMKSKPLEIEVIRFITQFNYEKYGFDEASNESYARLFHLWDHPSHPDSFIRYCEKHLIDLSEQPDFNFVSKLPLFSVKVQKSIKKEEHRYRNPNEKYFEDLTKSKDLTTIFASVLNVHNHFDAMNKFNYQTEIQEYASLFDFQAIAGLYYFDEQKNDHIEALRGKERYKELLVKAGMMESDRKMRLLIAKKLAEIVYGDRKDPKLLSKMIQCYDKYFLAYFNPRDFVVPGIKKRLSEITADLDVNQSEDALKLKEKANDLWVNSDESYRRMWLQYLYAYYALNSNLVDLENDVLTIMIFWCRKVLKELEMQSAFETL